MSRYYFAYASNLDAAQMERRCPGQQYRGKAFLPRHRMAFTHPSSTWGGGSADILEDQVTYPIVTALLGAPKVKAIRGFSDFGFSYVYVIFQDGTDLYWARSRVLEYLSKNLGLDKKPRAVRAGPIPLDEAALAKAQFVEYYVLGGEESGAPAAATGVSADSEGASTGVAGVRIIMATGDAQATAQSIGRELGLDAAFVDRQPFPGPGLAVRILGEVTPPRLDLLRRADAIVSEEVKREGWYTRLWQSFAVLLPVQSVGVMGDARTYEYKIGRAHV